MAVNAVIVHRIPGRVRMRIPDRRGDGNFFSALSERLAGIDTIRSVKANAATGSLVIEFSGSLDRLIEQLRPNGVHADIRQSPPAERIVRMPDGHQMKPFNIVTGRDINPLFMVGSLLAVLGVVQTFRGKILVPSLSAFWFAMEAFRQSAKAR